MTDPILTLDKTRRTNAELIVACRDLGYLSDDMLILDATLGKGRFWKRWLPWNLVTNDLHPQMQSDHQYDYCNLRFPNDHFGAVVFDPEYKLNGTSTGEGPAASDADYGVAREYRPIADRKDGWLQGFDECVRVCKPGGHILVKIMDQVVSDERRFLTKELWLHTVAPVRSWAPKQVDELYLYGWRKQPKRTRKCKRCKGSGVTADGEGSALDCAHCDGSGRVESSQHHAQQSLSVLMVFRKPKETR